MILPLVFWQFFCRKIAKIRVMFYFNFYIKNYVLGFN